MRRFVYDVGALIAAERDSRSFWILHQRAIDRGDRPVVPATVLAQVRRHGSHRGLAKLLKGCQLATMDRRTAELVGDLLGAAGRNDIVDAHVVVCCLELAASCVTSDRHDILHLAEIARTDRRLGISRRRVHIVAV